jgi:N-acetylneuraminate synthase
MINELNDHKIGPDMPCYIIAEIGINHNGDLDIAKKLIKIAKDAGFDVVKFQKRVPELCVPLNKRDALRMTPWGEISYFAYKEKIEFSEAQYNEIDNFCKELEIDWAASAWDIESVKFLSKYDSPFIKIPSDKAKDIAFIEAVAQTNKNVIISCGGTSTVELDNAFNILNREKTILLQCTSEYPTPTDRLNFRAMKSLEKKFGVNVGFSSHHTSPTVPALAAAYGAKAIEVHVTLDRAMWGTDQSMSIEPRGMAVMCNSIRMFETALGDPNKIVYDEELSTLQRTIKK